MTSENNPSALMGPAEVATYLGMAERTIYQWAQQKKLPAFKVGGVWRFRRSDVDLWLENNRSGPSSDEIEPLTPHIEPYRSKWRIKKDEEESDLAIKEACKAYILDTLQSVDREVFLVEQFEDRFGADVVQEVIGKLKKEKKILETDHEGLNGEKVKVIKKRS